MLDSASAASTTSTPETSGQTTAAISPSIGRKEIESWLTSYLASLLNLPESEVEPTVPFESFGLDSAAAVAMTGDLARWLGWDLDPNVATQYRTVEALGAYLSSPAIDRRPL
jgi:acyl carrier protein